MDAYTCLLQQRILHAAAESPVRVGRKELELGMDALEGV